MNIIILIKDRIAELEEIEKTGSTSYLSGRIDELKHLLCIINNRQINKAFYQL